MNEIVINEKISYLPPEENPLSAAVGIIREAGSLWLYDVGNGHCTPPAPAEGFCAVLSHFHPDHIGNLPRLPIRELYLSKETARHIPGDLTAGMHLVREPLRMGSLHIFPLPSSHAKGCLGLEIDGSYTFVGDALYGRIRDGRLVYNAQLLKEEIALLEKLPSSRLLVGHRHGILQEKAAVLEQLRAIYRLRTRDSSEIVVPEP